METLRNAQDYISQLSWEYLEIPHEAGDFLSLLPVCILSGKTEKLNQWINKLNQLKCVGCALWGFFHYNILKFLLLIFKPVCALCFNCVVIIKMNEWLGLIYFRGTKTLDVSHIKNLPAVLLPVNHVTDSFACYTHVI